MKKFVFALAVSSLFLNACGAAEKIAPTAPESVDIVAEETTLLEDVEDLDVSDIGFEGNDSNAKVSLDWAGTYEGTLPGAGGGIKTTLTLNQYLEYNIVSEYEAEPEETVEESGNFEWDSTGNIIILKGDRTTQYKVEEGRLKQLDEEGNIITGSLADLYILEKISDES